MRITVWVAVESLVTEKTPGGAWGKQGQQAGGDPGRSSGVQGRPWQEYLLTSAGTSSRSPRLLGLPFAAFFLHLFRC